MNPLTQSFSFNLLCYFN